MKIETKTIITSRVDCNRVSELTEIVLRNRENNQGPNIGPENDAVTSKTPIPIERQLLVILIMHVATIFETATSSAIS